MATEPASVLLARAVARRAELGLPAPDTTAYRLVAGEADGLHGFTVDAYDAYRVISVYDEDRADLQPLAEACMQLGARGVYVKRRPRQANALSEQERLSRAPSEPLLGDAAPEPLLVLENGVRFAVRLGSGLSTGIFLDQRLNRRRVMERASGRGVLNLFAYTCGFGLVAALGGAAQTVNVDVAKQALERGRENYALNPITGGEHLFLARDALVTLPRFARQGRRFSLIVLDPPSYASTKQTRLRVENALPELIAQASAVLEPHGALLVCANQAALSRRDFARLVEQGRAASGRQGTLELLAAPPEYGAHEGTGTALRTAWLELG